MSTVTERNAVTADESEQQALAALLGLLGEHTMPRTPTLSGPHGEEIALPQSVLHALRQLVRYLAQDKAVTIVPTNKELTTQEAADLLNVSRPYLVKLLEEGCIPFTKVGTHRRVRFSDLMAYKQRRDAERASALDRLTQLNQDMGLYDD